MRQFLMPRFIAAIAAIAAALFGPPRAVFSAGSSPLPLKEIYAEAERRRTDPQTVVEAAEKYKEVVEIHRENEKWYRLALQQLARTYDDSGQTEEGVRYFVTLALENAAADKQDVLREILAAYRLKHPDVFQKIVTEMGLGAGPQPRTLRPMPSEELSQAILQRDDQELREKSLDKLQQMLAADAPATEKKQALATLLSSLAAKFDRAPFRRLVLPLLDSDDDAIRAMALRSLPALETPAGELSRIVPLAEDESPQVRMHVGLALIQIGKGQHKEVVIPALTTLLKDSDPAVIEQTIRSMWGQYSSPQFDALLIELSRNPRYHHNVVYFGLSTMRPKSAAVCRRLVEELDDPDWNNSGRAAWGLTYGVEDEARKLVEEGLLKALPEETNAYTRGQQFRALGNVATEQSRAYLAKVADSELETEGCRQAARAILTRLDSER